MANGNENVMHDRYPKSYNALTQLSLLSGGVLASLNARLKGPKQPQFLSEIEQMDNIKNLEFWAIVAWIVHPDIMARRKPGLHLLTAAKEVFSALELS
jgi:hypothetical protein